MDPLSAENTYRSPRKRRTFPAGSFPSLYFYTRFIAVALRAAGRARRGAYDSSDWASDSLELLAALEATGVEVAVEGLDTLRTVDPPCVFVANHMSTFETMVLPGIIQPFMEVTFVVKRSLVAYPVFRHVMKSRDPLIVDRVNPREDLRTVLEKGVAKLGEGSSIVIFPQTTRSTILDPARFNSIGIKLARRAKVPVVPVALKTDAWGVGSMLKEFGRIDPSKTTMFSFGKPLIVNGNGREEHQRIVQYISARLQAWGSMPPEDPRDDCG
jgi:1-acyl-sn-glycerol-3-phosphate acyltransferase